MNPFDIVVEEGESLLFQMSNVTRLEQLRDRLIEANFDVGDVRVSAQFDLPGILTEEDVAIITELVGEVYEELDAAVRFEQIVGDIKAASQYSAA